MNWIKKMKLLLICILSLALINCSSTIKDAELFAAKDEWLQAVLAYRKALIKDPGDIELRSRLKQTELKAADFYYQHGLKMLQQKNIDAAIVQYQRGLIAKSDHSKLEQAMKDLLIIKEANRVYREGVLSREAERHEDAKKLFAQVLRIYPDHEQAALELQSYQLKSDEQSENDFALTSTDPVTLNFKKSDIRSTFKFLAKSFGITVIFDDTIKDVSVTLFAKDVTFKQALNLLLVTTKTFYKKLGKNTILLAPDSKEKRGQYEDYIIRSFALRNTKAKKMSAILKSMLSIKKLIINEKQNTIMVRSTADVLELVDKVIAVNDRKPAELILDVEILEVNRTKTEQLGLDFGSTISVAYESFTGSFSRALSLGTVTLPGISFSYLKQDIDAKILANPKIRVIDDKPAKIHIGDRVPLRSSTIQNVTGQTRTTYTYTDIGIKMTVEPDIHLDNSVTVKMNLEVSSLGQNLGTVSEPAFSIGTRNATTFMLLRDGETAILGGLIRDEDRRSTAKVPGLGDIPVLGRLFSNDDNQSVRTDVLLTITPRIVRGWDLPPKNLRNIYSGTEKTYTNQPIFSNFNDNLSRTDVEISESSQRSILSGKIEASHEDIINLRFKKPAYTVLAGGEIEVQIYGENLENIKSLPFEVLYNPSLVSLWHSEGELDEKNSTPGILRVPLYKINISNDKPVVIYKLKMKGIKPGISYLVFRTSEYQRENGDEVKTQVQTTRVIVH